MAKIKFSKFSEFLEYCDTKRKLEIEISEDLSYFKVLHWTERDGNCMADESYYKIPKWFKEALSDYRHHIEYDVIEKIKECVFNK